MATAFSDTQRKQIEQAEELLFSGPQKEGFVKDLFFGKFRSESVIPFPELPPDIKLRGDEMVERVKEYCQESIDPADIDVNARIPDSVVRGLGDLGVLGMTIKPEYGGGGYSQFNYCRAMEIIAELEPTVRGPYCGSLFYIGSNGNMDSNILIRTFVCRNGLIQCAAGGGIVADSDPQAEFEETLHKAEGMFRALR